MSDVVILVVGELTWPDQEFIESVQRKLRDSDKHHKTLIVVHNFYDIINEVDLLYLWQECVVSTMTGTVESLQMGGEFPAIYFKQQMKSGTELPSIHVFLAREESDAGKLWNEITYEFLRSKISQAHTPKKDVLHKLLINKTYDTLKLYTRSPEDVILVWIEDVPPTEKKKYKGHHEPYKWVPMSVLFRMNGKWMSLPLRNLLRDTFCYDVGEIFLLPIKWILTVLGSFLPEQVKFSNQNLMLLQLTLVYLPLLIYRGLTLGRI